MVKHIFAIIGSQAALFVLVLILHKSISNPGQYNTTYNILRICFAVMLSVSQSVFIYLLI